MKKIITAHLTHYRNEGHYGFMRVVLSLITASAVVRALLAVLLVRFEQLLSLAKTLVDPAHKSEYTQQIEAADQRVDRAIASIRKTVATALRHYNLEVAKAAQRLHDRLKDFGNIARKTYEEETAAINVLLADLQGSLAQLVSLLALDGWVAELAAAEAEFEALLALRTSETTVRLQERMADVRRDMDEVYHSMVTLVNAAAVVDSNAPSTPETQAQQAQYDEFIATLNTEITRFNGHADHHQTRKDIAAAVVEPIAPQPYTGEPVVLLPSLQYDSKKLVFSVDYTLSYRHNTNVGTADLIIRGKGRFKGQKVVTFSIVNSE